MTSRPPFQSWSGRVGTWCVVAACAVAAVVLLTWSLPEWRQTVWGSGEVPMAGSTALAILTLGAAVLVWHWGSHRKTAGWVACAGASAVAMLGALLWCERVFRLTWFGSDGSPGLIEALTGQKMGMTSSITAGLLVLLALAFLLELPPLTNRSFARRFASGLLITVALVSVVSLLESLAGVPLVYGQRALPIAAVTAVALILLNVHLGLRESVLSGSVAGAATKGSDLSPKPSPRWLASQLTVLTLVLAAIVTLGTLYLREHRAETLAAAQAELTAIADLKVRQIVNWRRERLADATYIHETPYAARRALDTLARLHENSTRRMFTGWLDGMMASRSYECALLFDDQLQLRLLHPEGELPVVSDVLRRALQQAATTREVVFTDLHRDRDGEPVYLDLLAPFVVRKEGKAENVPAAGLDERPTDRVAAILVLRLNAAEFLYPLLNTWPRPSASAETLLVRREGDEVVYLTDLRHQTNVALNLRVPLSATNRLTVQAMLGATGKLEGTDYRDRPALATARSVPGTPWHVVAKVDRSEVFAAYRQRAVATGLLGAALFLAAVLLVALQWRHRSNELLQRELATGRERLALAQRVEHLMKHANDAILLADENDRVLEANEKMASRYGYPLAKLPGMHLSEFRAPAVRAGFAAQSAQVLAAGKAVFETLHQRQDGTVFPVEISSNVVELDGRRCKLGILRDITERKAHEHEIERLNRLYATLSQINQAIVHITSRESLFQEVCRIAVEYGGFRLAWIGWTEAGSPRVRPLAQSGDTDGLVLQLEVYSDDRPEGGGLVGQCFRTGKTAISRDITTDPRTQPWQEIARAHDVHAAVVLPIREAERIAGVFAVYASEPGEFQDREIELLEEMATDVEFALKQLREREDLRQAEQALRESEELYRTLVAASPNAVTLSDLAGNTVFASAKARAMFGETADTDLRGRSVLDWVAPEDRTRALENVRRVPPDGGFLETEYVMRRADGSRFFGEVTVGVYRDSDGQPKGKIIVTRDIHARKQQERREQLHLHTLRLLATGTALPAVLESIVTQFEFDHPDWRCSILLVDDSGRRLVTGVAPRMPDYFQQAVNGIPIAEGSGICGTAAATKQLVIAEDVETHPHCTMFRELARRAGIRACWSQPILSAEGEVLGTFALYHAQPSTPKWEEIHAINAVTSLASIAIERRRAELALRQSEERLQLALAASEMGVWEWNLETDTVFSSPESLRILGAPGDNPHLTKEAFLQIVHPNDREPIMQAARRALADRSPFTAEFRILRPDGTLRWCADMAHCLYDTEGRPVRMVGTIRDITARKLAEDRLRKLSRAVEQSPVSIIITDRDGRIEYVNPRFTEATGYQFAEVAGQNPRLLKSGETPPEAYREMWETIARGQEWRGEFHNRKKNGELFWEQASISPIVDEAGRVTHFLAVKEDITERKRLEAEVRQSQKMEAVGQLAGGVAHDFNNVLAVIMLHLGLLRDSPQLDPAVAGSLKDLEAEARRAASLTRQLLQFSRRSVMQVRPLDLNEVVEHLLKMLRRLIGEHVSLQWQGVAKLPAVPGDIGMVEQVVMNLVVNARDAMPDGGRIVIATAPVTVTEDDVRLNPEARPGDFVCLSVADTGCGMEETLLKRIFEPFFTTKEAGKGTGLGLATVYGITKQHRGWITVESEVGKGSTFRVYLPAVPAAPELAPTAPTLQSLPRGDETILLVEDEVSLRKTTGNFLRLIGYRVIEATTGGEALDCWSQRQREIDLLLSDMVMPGGTSGLQLAHKLREDKPDLRVILTSGYSDELVRQSDLSGQGIAFLAKPCPSLELALAVRRSLDQNGD